MSRLKRCVALENIWYMSGIYGEDFITKSSVYFLGHATLDLMSIRDTKRKIKLKIFYKFNKYFVILWNLLFVKIQFHLNVG